MKNRRIPVAIAATLCPLACFWQSAEGNSFLGRARLRQAPLNRRQTSFIPPQTPRPSITAGSTSSNARCRYARRLKASSPDEPAPASTLELIAERYEEQHDKLVREGEGEAHKEKGEGLMDGMPSGFTPPIFAKGEGESTFIKNTLMTNVMFQSLPDKILDKLVRAFEKVEYVKKSEVITQGDPNVDYFYVLGKGECTVTIDKKQLPYPYGSLSEGTVFGELGLLYNEPRAATVAAKTDCTVYRVDRETCRFFLDTQQPGEMEDVKAELKVIDDAIDKIAGVKTRYDGSIIQQYKPQRHWLWRRWKGTVFQQAYKFSLINMALAAALTLFIRRRPDCTWSFGTAPDPSHPIISRMAAFGKHWRYLQTVTIFSLTFFLGHAYTHWRAIYSSARKIQGRLNDIGLLVVSTATRDKAGRYTPEAESVLDDVGSYVRLFHAFLWAKYSKAYNSLMSPRGMSRMLSRGLMTQAQFNLLQNNDYGAQNVCFEWMTIRALKGREDGGLRDDDGSMKCVLLGKMCELSAVYSGIGSILDGRIPLAYTHIVQVLVDIYVLMAPIALFGELGSWSVLSVGILTLFYSGLLDLAKTFLDPLDNDDFCNESINMDIGTLVRESNGGSTRWKNGAAILPFW